MNTPKKVMDKALKPNTLYYFVDRENLLIYLAIFKPDGEKQVCLVKYNAEDYDKIRPYVSTMKEATIENDEKVKVNEIVEVNLDT